MQKLAPCLTCGNKLPSQSKACSHCSQSKILKEKNVFESLAQLECEKCTYRNLINAIQCQMCEHIFEQNLVLDEKDKFQPLITCKYCKFQNHLSNQVCLNCLQFIFQNPEKKCHSCGQSIKQNIFDTHLIECRKQKQLARIKKQNRNQVKPQNTFSSSKHNLFNQSVRNPFIFNAPVKRQLVSNYVETNECGYCEKKFNHIWQKEQHKFECQIRLQLNKKTSDPSTRLSPLQVQALIYMNDIASNYHKQVKKDLQLRIMRIGYKNQDLENLQFYIQNYAPIIIQIHVSKHMKFFIKDTHYRNQFQTNISSGSLSRATRSGWQNNMFDYKYSKATDFQRVKYGVINFSNDPKGVLPASDYGPSYFLLKNHVRQRCTFTQKNIKSKDAGTIKYCLKILVRMNDEQLRAAFQAARALEVSSKICPTYKQVQIHGPIQFSKDIQRIYVSEKQIKGNKKLLDMVYQFSKINKVDYDFI